MKWIEFLFLHTKSKTLSTCLIISIDSKDYNKTSFDSRNCHHKIEYLNPNKEFSRNDNYGKRGYRYHILSTFNLRARPQKFQKYYLFSTRPQKHLDWRGATRSGIRTLEVHFQVKLTKMPLVNPGLTESQSRSKLSQNNIFHVSTFYIKSRLLGDFCQVWPKVDSWGHWKP